MSQSPEDSGGQDLREQLERLHTELQRTQSVDEETRALLESLMVDTRHLIEHEGDELTERHQTLNGRLEEAVARFEGTHPDLAYVMARVIDTLSGLGI
jgi:Domain of unknown function (DUF4404)